MTFISVTRLRVRAWRFVPAFMWRTSRSMAQSRRARGFVGGRVMREAGNVFWTVTAWEEAAAMNAFRTSGAHRVAMPKLLEWCDEASVAHWTQDYAELPSWAEAHGRMMAEGRFSKVNHPSAEQEAGEIPPPRPSRVENVVTPA